MRSPWFPSKTMRRRPRHLEEGIQTVCVAWYRLSYPGRLIFAIPNGGKRNVLEAIRLKAQGVTAGVPDLFIPEPMYGWPGLWVEMKSEEGRTRKEQRDMQAILKAKGYKVETCRSLEEFQKTTTNYFERKNYAEVQI